MVATPCTANVAGSFVLAAVFESKREVRGIVHKCISLSSSSALPSHALSKGTMDCLSLVVSCSLNISADSCVFNDIMIKIILCQKQLSHAYTRTHTCIAKDISDRTPTGCLSIYTYICIHLCMAPQRVCFCCFPFLIEALISVAVSYKMGLARL